MENKQQVPLLACSPREATSLFFIWGEGRVWPGVRPEGWLRCFSHPLGGVVCRGHDQYPVFAPNPLLLLQALPMWQLGFLVSVSFVQNLP